MTGREVDTPYGPARAELHCAPEGRAALLLGHGAGGGFGSSDLVAAARGAHEAGVHVALVEQPYRVAGRRAPAPAAALDTAWLAVADVLAGDWFPGLPLVFGGRSSGARVACRTAADGQAVAVVCLAFPVHPPGRPDKDRGPELAGVTVPTLVVQGERDPFGMPGPAHHREVVVVRGTHTINRGEAATITRTVSEWLQRVLRPLD